MTTRLTPFLAAILILGCGSENENRPEGDSAVSLPNQDQGPLSHDGGINPDARAAEDAAPPAADTGQMDVGSVVDAMPSLDLGAGTDAMLPPAPPTAEHAFILPVNPNDADWHDLAYLAAISASAHLNGDRPVVIALADEGDLGDSATDFLRRFAPKRVTILGAPNIAVNAETVVHDVLDNLDATTARLAATWAASERVVIAPAGRFGDALLAASFAARIDAPLFFVDEGVSPTVREAIERLAPDQVFTVGELSAPDLGEVTPLTDADAVIDWLKHNQYPLDYFAVVNPNDRDAGRSQKLSLTASLYTTRRSGLVIPVETEIPSDTGTGLEMAKVTAALTARYARLGRHPEHLALVGSFDVIPIHRTRSLFDVPEREWPVTDIPYGQYDDDPFRDIALGRIFTDSLYRGSLLAARSVTYELLHDGVWEQRFIESGLWGFDELRAILLNVGFDAPEHLTEAQIQQRPSLEAGAILHKDHSNCTVLGNAFTVQTPAVYAPAIVMSRGCSVAGIDLVPVGTPTVPGKMLGRGAVAFIGAPRNSIAGNTVTEVAFFNALLQGETLGQAMRSAFNNATVHYLDEGEDAGMRYVLDNEMLFGDPGLRFHVPAEPVTAPAHATLAEDVLTVAGPAQWTQVQFVPDQLAEWNYEGDLFMYVGPGAEPKTYWSGQYDNEDLYYTVGTRLPPGFMVGSLVDMAPRAAPLGWHGRHYVDVHQDDTSTLRFRVRLLDYDMQTGMIRDRVDQASYRLAP